MRYIKRVVAFYVHISHPMPFKTRFSWDYSCQSELNLVAYLTQHMYILFRILHNLCMYIRSLRNCFFTDVFSKSDKIFSQENFVSLRVLLTSKNK